MRLFLILMILCPAAFAGPVTIYGLPTGSTNPTPVNVNTAGQITTTLSVGENETLGVTEVFFGGSPVNLTATGAVKAEAGALVGVFVSASTSCTITLHDNASAASGTVVLGTTAAITAPAYLPIPALFSNGLYFTEGGTCDVTFYIL